MNLIRSGLYILSRCSPVLLALLFSQAASAQAQHLPAYYEITEIKAPPAAQYTYATALNESLQVAAYWADGSGQYHSGVIDTRSGAITRIGTLGGLDTQAWGMNNLGEVVGWSETASGRSHAFLYSNGVLSDLGVLDSAPDLASFAYAINDSGYVVGFAYYELGTGHAVTFLNGSAVVLDPSCGPYCSSGALAVNNLGQAAGWTPTWPSGAIELHAATFSNGTATDLGPLGMDSWGIDINDQGYVLEQTHWFDANSDDWLSSFIRAPDGAITPIRPLPGLPNTTPWAINYYGLAVGMSSDTTFPYGNSVERAFVWGDCRTWDLTNMIDPGSPLRPFVTLLEAHDINNQGYIIANGYDSRTPSIYSRAYLLKPVGTSGDICT